MRGIHIDYSSRTTVAEFARAYVDTRAPALAPHSLRNYGYWLRRYVDTAPLGNVPVGKVSRMQAHGWVAGLAKDAPKQAWSIATLVSAAFSAAVREGLMRDNPLRPARELPLPKLDRPKFTPLTVAQVRAWAEAADPRIQAMIRTMAGLGLRPSELRALRVSDVDWLGSNRKVRIEWQFDGPGRHRVPLKTRRSRREIPLPEVVHGVLSAHLARFPAAPDGTIFTNAGRQWPASGTLCRLLARAREDADLPKGTSSRHLRHHYASVLLHAGLSVHAVAERLGDSPKMVHDVYGHVMPGQEDVTRKAIDGAWDQAAAGDSETG